jgi:hypothetical protein
MKFITHNDKGFKWFGGCLQGHITATYEELEALFGEPHESDAYKVDAEWDIIFADGTKSSIYNWKNGKNYCGGDGMDVADITRWHIGGDNLNSVTRVQDILAAARAGTLGNTKPAEPAKLSEAAKIAEALMGLSNEDLAAVSKVLDIIQKVKE